MSVWTRADEPFPFVSGLYANVSALHQIGAKYQILKLNLKLYLGMFSLLQLGSLLCYILVKKKNVLEAVLDLQRSLSATAKEVIQDVWLTTCPEYRILS